MKTQSKPATARKPAARTVKVVAAPKSSTPAFLGTIDRENALSFGDIKKRNLAAGHKTATGQWQFFRETIARESMADRIRRIRDGGTATLLVGAAESLGVSREAIFGMIGIPTSTANRKITKRETLDMAVTERLARLALIEDQAEDTFGDKELAKRWLRTDNRGLGGCTPLSMLDTEFGTREVTKVLAAIAHGGAA